MIQPCLKQNKELYYFNASNRFASMEFSTALNQLIKKHCNKKQEIVFVCIGSDRATGDCLGPIIGHQLTKLNFYSPYFFVYGTLEEPIHAKNLEEQITMIKYQHKNCLIIAIDASLGSKKHIGYITLGEGALKPGLGVSKDLPEVGDLCITGIVNFSGMLDSMLLQTTRLNIVMKLADCILTGIRYSLYQYRTTL